MGELSYEVPTVERPQENRLDSWKEIASYLKRDVTTVQRWEKREQMPVRRHVHSKRGSVYALTDELDEWIRSRSVRLDEAEKQVEAELPAVADGGVAAPRFALPRTWLWFGGALVVSVFVAWAAWLGLRHRTTDAAVKVVPAIRSLAVLPLENLSGDPRQEYLADGITEALTGRLANIHDLRVVSHTSVLRFKNPRMSVPEISRILGADAVVEGSVIREGDRIRVTAQLIRSATDEHFWSETYDRQMSDAITLESELAQAIAEKVEVTVTGEEHRRLISARAVAPEVYESYLQGRFALGQGNIAEVQQSIVDFEGALERDPTFAPADLGLARAYFELGTVFAGASPQMTRPKVTSYARKALALDPTLVEGHVMLANVLQEQWHWAEAEAEYKRALDLNPNDAAAQAGYAMWLMCRGRTEEAAVWIEHARALDPVGITGGNVSWILFHARRYDEAVREARSALAVQPKSAGTLLILGFALIADDKPADAIPVLESALTYSPGSPAVSGVLIRAYAHAGRRDDALRLLAELKRRRRAGYVPAAAFVNAFLGLGDKDQAFYWLEQARREQSNILQFVLTHPYFDPIRGDPRFAELVRQVGLA